MGDSAASPVVRLSSGVSARVRMVLTMWTLLCVVADERVSVGRGAHRMCASTASVAVDENVCAVSRCGVTSDSA